MFVKDGRFDMITRRTFIKTGVALTAIGALSPQLYAGSRPAKEKAIGLQLYSAREDLQKDAEATIKTIVEIGYKRLEAFGYKDGKFFGKTPKGIKDFLSGLGAQLTGSHTGMPLLEAGENTAEWNAWKKTTEDTAEAGCKWIVQASYPTRQIKNISDVRRLAAQFNKCGEIAKAHGLKFAFHNHHDEFARMEGLIPFDVLVQDTDPALVAFQMDTGHLLLGGFKCHDYVRKYPGRFSNWHLRDVNQKGEGTEFGKGLVDFKALFAVADIAALEDYYVEQGQYTIPPIEALKHNYNFLIKAPYVKK
jgi:sugar phosphate isomerase/epimerase